MLAHSLRAGRCWVGAASACWTVRFGPCSPWSLCGRTGISAQGGGASPLYQLSPGRYRYPAWPFSRGGSRSVARGDPWRSRGLPTARKLAAAGAASELRWRRSPTASTAPSSAPLPAVLTAVAGLFEADDRRLGGGVETVVDVYGARLNLGGHAHGLCHVPAPDSPWRAQIRYGGMACRSRRPRVPYGSTRARELDASAQGETTHDYTTE